MEEITNIERLDKEQEEQENKRGIIYQYEEYEISRQYPTCFLFLIDQSSSMSDIFSGESIIDPISRKEINEKRDMVADCVNRTLSNLKDACTKGFSGTSEDVRHYFDIGAIGYGTKVDRVLGGNLKGKDLVSINEIATYPLRIEERKQIKYDGIGGIIESKIKIPIWIEPTAGGSTPMCEALRQAYSILKDWTDKHYDCFPPTVINVTDGEVNDGDPIGPANELKKLYTKFGNVLLFNIHISSRKGDTPIIFPDHKEILPDTYALKLFEMSSILPGSVQKYATQKEIVVKPQSRGFIYKADIINLVNLLNVGTQHGRRVSENR